jgi:predicted Zn-dependent peptidase
MIGSEFKKTVLSSGVRVVTERHPQARAVSVGFFVDVGTRDESELMNGAAHFIEHMVFKGTLTRGPYDIAKSLEAVGGELNAFTSREETCYHASCLAADLPLALDVLSDLVSNAEFSMADLRKEREVIKQEIAASLEDPEDRIYDLMFGLGYKGHPLARPILGTEKTLDRISRKKLFDFYHGLYHGPHVVVAVAGQVEHNRVCEQLERALKIRRKKASARQRRRPKFQPFTRVEAWDAEQTHVLIGLPVAGLKDRERFSTYVINAALGGGMTSRLYQSVREDKGLSYAVYSSVHGFQDAGLMTVYLATANRNTREAVSIVSREMDRLWKRGLTARETDDFKRQVMGEISMDAEDIDSRMQSIGAQELLFENYRGLDDVLAQFSDVTAETVTSQCQKIFAPQRRAMVVLGAFKGSVPWKT